MLEVKNRGVATYYIPGEKLEVAGKTIQPEHKRHQLESKRQQPESKRHQLESKRHQLESQEAIEDNNDVNIELLPQQIQEMLKKLGKKAPKENVRRAILMLCNFDEMTANEIAGYLKRGDKRRLVRSFLTPMVKEHLLEYKYPQMPGHPNQRYRTKKVKK